MLRVLSSHSSGFDVPVDSRIRVFSAARGELSSRILPVALPLFVCAAAKTASDTCTIAGTDAEALCSERARREANHRIALAEPAVNRVSPGYPVRTAAVTQYVLTAVT